MSDRKEWWPLMSDFVLLLVGIGLCVWLGYRLGLREVDSLRVQYATATAQAAEQAGRQLRAAAARGDALVIELAAVRRHAQALSKELNDEISRLTDGRACLYEPALRLLDRAPGLSVRLPASASDLAGADASAVATDTQLASWAIDAGAQYADCARRLGALIDWHGDTR